MREIIIIAGANGAGKTSFANEYLPAEHEQLLFINADEIARDLAATGLSGLQLDLRAGRMMLEQIDEAVRNQREIMFETTLASLSYARKIPGWQHQGYHVSLIYLSLPNVASSIARVQKRVAAGGHNIPEEIIRRRFDRSLEYLETRYKPIVDEWYIWNSLEGDFQLVEAWDDE
ncbi:MAG: zeta toxin family protein [Proteobacteria bacterium]|nr:zeta toxin family protein [Pseudomonadota bacterium]